jgi:hypothetical protein
MLQQELAASQGMLWAKGVQLLPQEPALRRFWGVRVAESALRIG